MNYPKNFFMRSPDDLIKGTAQSGDKNDDKKIKQSQDRLNDEGEEEKTVSEKIHDALQDWSNDDQRDQDFDDTRP